MIMITMLMMTTMVTTLMTITRMMTMLLIIMILLKTFSNHQGANVVDLEDKRLHILDDTLYISDISAGQEVSQRNLCHHQTSSS